MSMSISGFKGRPLEVSVIQCNNLDHKRWFTTRDPYVSVEYGNNRYRTKTCKGGGKHPHFQERFIFTLVEGLHEINVVVWNSHTFRDDYFIGSGKIPVYKALTNGFDDAIWPVYSRSLRYSGEIRLILHFPSASAKRTPPERPPQEYTPSPQAHPPEYSQFTTSASISPYRVQDQPFEVTVVQCNNLDDKEYFKKKDPYVCVEYGNDRYQTKICKGAGTKPTFHERFHFKLIGDLQEVIVVVWNRHTFRSDNFIGMGKIPLYKAIVDGFDDSIWPVYGRCGSNSGEIRIMLHFPNANINSCERYSPRELSPPYQALPKDPCPGFGFGFYPPPPY